MPIGTVFDNSCTVNLTCTGGLAPRVSGVETTLMRASAPAASAGWSIVNVSPGQLRRVDLEMYRVLPTVGHADFPGGRLVAGELQLGPVHGHHVLEFGHGQREILEAPRRTRARSGRTGRQQRRRMVHLRRVPPPLAVFQLP